MLREVLEGDLQVFFEHQRDPLALELAVFVSREREAFFDHWRTRVLGEPSGCARTIVVEGKPAGFITSYASEGRRLIGYWLGREYWGRGLASAALAAFLEVDPHRPLEAFVAASNARSIRVLEKCGFGLVPGSGATGSDGVEEVRYRLDVAPGTADP